MRDEIKDLQKERSQNLRDLFDNKIPRRVPLNIKLPLTVIADYGRIDRKSAYWDPALLLDAADSLCGLVFSDSCIYSGTVYAPYSSQTLGAINKVMSSTGYMQHSNHECMKEEEYDEFIADPYAFAIDKCLPRLYKNLNISTNPGRVLFTLVQEAFMEQLYYKKVDMLTTELNKKHGYPTDVGGEGFGRAPMDWIADQLRGFTGICTDVRRHRAKLLEALDAVYPLIYKMSCPPDLEDIDRYTTTMFQLHMPTFLRVEDFAEVWLPSWRRLVTDYASLGVRCGAFLEDDWTHLLDYLYELPTGMYFTFEFTDPRKIKEKLGKKFILGGGFPIKYLTTCSKEKIIDKTKEWLDIMAPGGQYIFGFDKDPLAMSDINLDNLIAVCNTVREYGVYDNPGTPTGEVFARSDYTHSDAPEFTSKYFKGWDDYLEEFPYTPEEAKPLVTAAEDLIFRKVFYMTC